MEEANIWSKMRRWLNSGSKPEEPKSEARAPVAGTQQGTFPPGRSQPADDGRRFAPPGPEPQRDPVVSEPAVDAPTGGGGLLSRRRTQDQTLEKLHGSYDKLVGLVDSIQHHQAEQDSRAAEISSSLSGIRETLVEIREKNSDHGSVLSRVADELQTANARAARWEERLADLPTAVQAQRDALTAISRQLDFVRQRDEQFLESLSLFRDAVSTLSDATTSSSVAIKNLQITALENDDRVAGLLKVQNKRFMVLLSLMALLTAGAATVGIVTLMQ